MGNKQQSSKQSEQNSTNVSGGVNMNSRGNTAVQGDVVGRDKIVNKTEVVVVNGKENEWGGISWLVFTSLAIFVAVVACLIIGSATGILSFKAPSRPGQAVSPTQISQVTPLVLHVPDFSPTIVIEGPINLVVDQMPPEQFILSYYQLVGSSNLESRDYDAGWNNLSPDFINERTKEGRKKYGPGFVFTKSYYIDDWSQYSSVEVTVDLLPDQPSTATWRKVSLRYFCWNLCGNGFPELSISLKMRLVADGVGGWKIDHTEPLPVQ